MGRMTWIWLVAVVVPGATSAQMGMGMMGRHGMGMMSGSPLRHQYVMRFGLDPTYARLRNPLPPTRGNVEAGKDLFAKNCAACHGDRGYGDGPAARTLDPPPANLRGIARGPMTSDGYLYWTIAEGGAPVGSAMPQFKATLSRDDIWKLILFVRSL